ncbi:14345_t:CDS:2 [Cetraspora pellucida]|uniref:14345_t:CDS:1 n=1 Tax=Cetraspora pellucida TaxID=1433469 RepID=A0A9N9P0A2_9GLOM|nr:14345_t:CDS:2 [Cetraspora pellucida]
MLRVWHLIEQNLKTNCYKLFDNNDNYLEFKKQVEALHLTFDEEHINVAMNSIKNTTEMAHDQQKPLAYIESLMKDSKLWVYAFTKHFCHMGISTTGCAKLSHIAFKHAIEMASGLESVFEAIDQRMRVQHLKNSMNIGNNKITYDLFIIHDPYFSIILGKVSVYAINQIKRQLAKNPIPLSIIDKRWNLHRPEIKYLSQPSLESPVTDPEFYKVFLKAEDLFHKLPDDPSMRTEFISHIREAVTMPLSEPVKAPKIKVQSSHPFGMKCEKLKSEKQELEAKKKQKLLNKFQLKQKDNNILYSLATYYQNVDIYKENVPKFIDGNCGFHAIAISLGMSEDEWLIIRQNIFNKLTNQKSHYIELFIEGEAEYNNIISIIQ